MTDYSQFRWEVCIDCEHGYGCNESDSDIDNCIYAATPLEEDE